MISQYHMHSVRKVLRIGNVNPLYKYWKVETNKRVLWQTVKTQINAADPDEMQHDAAFHQDLHCLLRLKQPSGTEVHHNLENATCDPIKYTIGSPILIVSICKGKSIRIQRVKKSQKICTIT